MARRRRRRRKPRWLGPLVVVALVLLWALAGEQLRQVLQLPGDGVAPPKVSDRLRVVTWNLRNFPDRGQNIEGLGARLRALSADLIAVQEVHDGDALRALMPGWELALSETGGRGGQKLGFLYDPSALELVGSPREHRALAMGGRVRPGFSGYLRTRGGGPDFHVLVVHLKARGVGLELRRSQWQVLAEIVQEIARDDGDVIVLGDFNATGPPEGEAHEELQLLDVGLAAVGLQRVANRSGCTVYWDGARRDAWHEPSQLDLVWVAGLLEAGAAEVAAEPLLHCARHACAAFRSTRAYPERDYADLSDHCPVVVDFTRGVDDDP